MFDWFAGGGFRSSLALCFIVIWIWYLMNNSDTNYIIYLNISLTRRVPRVFFHLPPPRIFWKSWKKQDKIMTKHFLYLNQIHLPIYSSINVPNDIFLKRLRFDPPPCRIFVYRPILMKFWYDVNLRITMTPMTSFVKKIQKFKNSPKIHLWTHLHNSACKWKILDDTISLYRLFILFMPMMSYYDGIDHQIRFRNKKDIYKDLFW